MKKRYEKNPLAAWTASATTAGAEMPQRIFEKLYGLSITMPEQLFDAFSSATCECADDYAGGGEPVPRGLQMWIAPSPQKNTHVNFGLNWEGDHFGSVLLYSTDPAAAPFCEISQHCIGGDRSNVGHMYASAGDACKFRQSWEKNQIEINKNISKQIEKTIREKQNEQ